MTVADCAARGLKRATLTYTPSVYVQMCVCVCVNLLCRCVDASVDACDMCVTRQSPPPPGLCRWRRSAGARVERGSGY